MKLIFKTQFWKSRLFYIFCCGFYLWRSCSVAVYAAEANQSEKGNTSLGSIITLSSNAVVQISNWLQPKSVKTVVEQYAPYIYAYFTPVAWPEIHPHARASKVPILMYHDIVPQKIVFFDVTPVELEQHFQKIKESGATPISPDLLALHLRTGIPLPKKPVLLTFDDGYGGHYQYVYPLLKKYNYPALFAIYIKGVGNNTGRTHVSWEQVREMASNPLVTIASHSVTHPLDLRRLSDEQLQMEMVQSKSILESYLKIPIRYFVYPVGKYDQRVVRWVTTAGYYLAFTMDDSASKFAGVSKDLLTVERIGQSDFNNAISQAWGGSELEPWNIK